jgi:menaquinone-9 beta-reductase
MTTYDVLVVGGGPAGATAAALTARAGLSTLVLERTQFPREKVCGDCFNPGAWKVLDHLGASEMIDRLPSTRLRWVDFRNIAGQSIRFELPDDGRGERGIRRKLFDDALIKHAMSLGAEVRFGEPVLKIVNGPTWQVSTNNETVQAGFLIAADGRNSSVARFLMDYPKTYSDRVALQTHFSSDAEPHVALQLFPHGYLGLATVGENLTNLCLVCRPQYMQRFRQEAWENFGLPADHRWQSITPLTRSPIQSTRRNLIYIGDAARVVEPLTGEGILYALQTGASAAKAICRAVTNSADLSFTDLSFMYNSWHARIYRNRLWVNELAKLAVLHPRISSTILELLRFYPAPLKYLTNKVVMREGQSAAQPEFHASFRSMYCDRHGCGSPDGIVDRSARLDSPRCRADSRERLVAQRPCTKTDPNTKTL